MHVLMGAAEFFDVGKAASWMQKIAYDALDEIPSTEAFILRKQAEAVQASRQAVSVPEWIKCSDRLPDTLDVWIKMTDGSVVACWSRLCGDFYWNGGGSESCIFENTVTHWKPRQQETGQ